MADIRITDVPTTSAITDSDYLYIRTGNNFRRVLVSALMTALESSGFYKTGIGGIPDSDIAQETVIITAGEPYTSSRTASQIYAALDGGSRIAPELWPDAENTIRGVVLDIAETSSVFAFLDYISQTPKILVVTVGDLSVSVEEILLGGGSGGGVVPAPGVGDEGKVPMVVNGVVVWAAIPETTTSEIDAIIAAI